MSSQRSCPFSQRKTASETLVRSVPDRHLAEICRRSVRPNTATRTFEFKPFAQQPIVPSGHASEAFTVATAIAENYPVWWVQTFCCGGAGLVGYARTEQNAHYASDVVAGLLLGWAVARAVVRRHNGPPNPHELSWSRCADGDGARLVFCKSF